MKVNWQLCQQHTEPTEFEFFSCNDTRDKKVVHCRKETVQQLSYFFHQEINNEVSFLIAVYKVRRCV